MDITTERLDKLESEMGSLKQEISVVLVPELNALSIAETVHLFMAEVGARLTALENEVATQRNLVTAQSRVIGEAMARMMGSGSTVQE
jgi:uncharacterized coiled-coil protein SlyX